MQTMAATGFWGLSLGVITALFIMLAAVGYASAIREMRGAVVWFYTHSLQRKINFEGTPFRVFSGVARRETRVYATFATAPQLKSKA